MLAKEKSKVSRSYVRKLITDGKTILNGSKITKTSKNVHTGDVLKVTYDTSKKAPENADQLTIIEQTDDYIVVDKPSGVLSAPRHDQEDEFTVVDLLRKQGCEISSDAPRNGIVHRLDRGTSGCMIVAKNKEFHAHITDQFAKRSVSKTYTALCSGTYDGAHEVHIDAAIERNPKKPYSFRVGSGGKSAQTKLQLKEMKPNLFYVSASPITGRTHQIRVHCNYIGLPVIGDTFYGGAEYSRLLLHSRSISFLEMNDTKVEYVSAEPSIFSDYIKDNS